MKVALVVQDMCGQGVQYATAMTARMFIKRGWEVDLLVSQVHFDCAEKGQRPFELPQCVTWVRMPSRRARGNVGFLRHYLGTHVLDMVIVEGMLYNKAMVLATIGRSKRTLPKLVMVTHGNTDAVGGGAWARWFDAARQWLLYRKLSALLVVNQRSADNMRVRCRWMPNLVVANVNNACVDEVFYEKVKLPPTHPWLLKKTCPTLVAAGAYQPYKDHMTLLRAMKAVKDQGKHVRVIIFGRGPLESEYRDYITANGLEDWVSVGGFTDRLPAELKASDGFVLSSNWESFGIVLAEGLACGVPCVATDAPYGPREILADGRYGRIVPVGDDKAMAKALIDCAHGRIPAPPDESWKRYTIEAIAKRYFEALDVQ